MLRRPLFLCAAISTALLSFAAWAQSPALPTPKVEEVMVKVALLTLNDANLTGNYNVLYAKMAQPFRERFSADTLKRAFRDFSGHHIDVIAGMPIVATEDPRIADNGTLLLRGYFDTTPSRLSYELDYAMSEGEWKLITIDVKVRSTQTNASATDLVARAAADLEGGGARK
ncbi:hypothetical protein ACFQZO_18700 [Bradyrhizobium sp. GCM10027634]|uniref:hypothetical protein n=1 Tax=unclassified Bradyrhizobium TaxID=2631580 RepID=UPI00188B26F7|nr:MULTISPECIES: hypothetical protein [unclassified Bradyrhizobium]MDN5002863.1 hypothetical protein [Bradyrhizobium sp. WYCCWR 12677]QOZ42081.1 hypothetical protein XH89_00340 [Bradyrhizobium sp. CCBAU 53340]